MLRAVVAAALLVGCRGDHAKRTVHDDAGSSGPASSVSGSVVPRLPASVDGAIALRELDDTIAVYRKDPRMIGTLIAYVLQRASIRGQLADYEEALALSTQWIEQAPKELAAWKMRVTVLGRVHRFGDARAALEVVKRLTTDASEWTPLEATLDEATGQLAKSGPFREQLAKQWPNTMNLTQWAASLALTGRFDEAIALIPRAAAELRDTQPTTMSWLLFQWGRLYEQKGELAAARKFYEAAHARLPGYLEATVHLAQTMTATGSDPRALVAAALADNPHPELLALAGQTEAARTEWERYLAAFPEAFSDHAARFFLGPGRDPARALVLARANLANRDTLEARALVVEAALAAKDPLAACAVVEPLMTAPRPQQFVAWRALSACGRTADADRLAKTLGIR